MARWEEAYDALLDVYKFYASERGHSMADVFAKSVDGVESVADIRPGSLVYRLGDTLTAMAFNAEPVYVDPDMMTVFEAAWPGFNPEPLAPTDFVTPVGFVLLPRPIRMKDVHDKETTTRAFMWAPVQMREGRKDQSREEVLAQEPHSGVLLALLHATEDIDDYSIPGSTALTPYVLEHVMPWSFDDPADRVTEENADPRSVVRPIQCLLRLMMQSIAAPERMSAPRQARKRWEKVNMTDKKVTVVRLRRPYSDNEPGEPGETNWASRWLVGGHWRNQWYPSVQLHRQIWISPYVKGPEGLPLVVKKSRVFEWVR